MHSLKVSPDDLDSSKRKLTADTESLTVLYLDAIPAQYMGWPAGGADEAAEPEAGRAVNQFLSASSTFAASMGTDLTSSATSYRNNEDHGSLRSRGIQEN